MPPKILENIKATILSLIILFSVSYAFAWSGPSANPPDNGSITAPVNTGNAGQTKNSWFASTELLASLDVTSPKYCIGASCITSWANTVPTGAVMAFELASCPSGWTAYAGASGREIIGVGNSNTSGSSWHNLDATGGEEKHTQTIDEMPSHNHDEGFNYTNSDGVGSYGGRISIHSADSQPGGDPYTRNTGGGQAFNVMDPYVALLYCKKY